MNDLSHQVSQIVNILAGLEGSSDISVTARRYPRMGPAESGTGFEQKSLRFSTSQIPPHMPVFPEADEVVIRVDGELLYSDHAGNLKRQVNAFMVESEIGAAWDVRGRFRNAPKSSAYQFVVFTNYVSRSEELELM